MISPLAHVDPAAKIGKDVTIYPFAFIDKDVEIGDNCTIYPYASLMPGTRLGNNCRVFQGAIVAAEPQDFRYKGDDSLCVVGNNVIMSNLASLAGHAIVEDRAVIGGMAGVHQFVKIGRNAMVGGMSKLTQDVVPYTIVDGHPAKAVGLNSVGISRAGIPLESRRRIKQAYKILYRSGLSLTQAIAVIEQEVDSCDEIEHFLRFLRDAERGICRERHND